MEDVVEVVCYVGGWGVRSLWEVVVDIIKMISIYVKFRK